MSRALAIGCLMWFGLVLMAESATAIVYIPGQYRDGIYIQPHFRKSGEAGSKHEWLQRLQESPARTDKADAKLPPAKPAPDREKSK